MEPSQACVIDLGVIEYGKAWELQLDLVEKRRRDEIADTLLLCEHPHVVTVGRRATAYSNILSNRFPIYEVERGGDATYHGPGQLVGYPIFKLHSDDADPHKFLRSLEQALCFVCEDVGVPAVSKDRYTGVWTKDGERKLASLGIAIRNQVTFHGFALNVTTQLSCFGELHPCGLSSSVMTSLAKEFEEQQAHERFLALDAEIAQPTRDRRYVSPLSVQSISPLIITRIGERFQKTFQGNHQISMK